MIKDEQKWYEIEKLEMPHIPFFDNADILSMNINNI